MQARGSNAVMKISGAETVFGTTPATPAGQIFPFETEGLSAKTALSKSNIIRASRNPVRPYHEKKDVSGNIKTDVHIAMARILKALFGACTTTGAGPYTHVFKIGSSLPSHAIEKGFTDIGKYLLYNGCKINKGGFEVNPAGIMPFDFDFLGASRTVGSATFDAAAVDVGFAAFEGFDAALKEGGVTIATITALKWALENDLDGDVYCIGGAGKRYDIPEGSTVVSGSITALFESETLLNKAINGTESSIQCTLTRGTGAGTAGNESLDLQFPELIFQEQDPIIKDRKGILIELPWTAYWDNDAGNSAVIATLKNTQTNAN